MQSALTQFVAAMRVSLSDKTSQLKLSSERASPIAEWVGFAFCAAAASGTLVASAQDGDRPATRRFKASNVSRVAGE